MKTLSITFAICFFYAMYACAQPARFVTSGSIVYEKSVNIYGLIKQHMGKKASPTDLIALERYKEGHPQFRKYTATLVFNNGESLYTPQAQPHEKILMDFNPMDDAGNIVYNNLTTRTGVTQKNIYDEIFLVKDKLRDIKWRYTGETREIAGYTCRRANAVIMDSVYVVAFYSDKIHVGGGPESFTGLPGMILGIALPYENVTWFATKVTDTTVPTNSIAAPKDGKAINNLELVEFLKQKMKTWGPTGLHERKVFAL